MLYGDYFALIGDYPKAIEKYNFVLKQNDFFSIAYLKRGNVYAALGQLDKAAADWQMAESRGIKVNEQSKKTNNRCFL
jgi:tetratricopeptide (TPR) repeat protein